MSTEGTAVGFHLTPHIMEATYELLRAVPPFKGWRLPPGENVRFVVTASSTKAGTYTYSVDKPGHEIQISFRLVRQFSTLLPTMAHEMCHMRERLLGTRHDIQHSAAFKKAAAVTCRVHGWDEGMF
jgi:hypothetical protein